MTERAQGTPKQADDAEATVVLPTPRRRRTSAFAPLIERQAAGADLLGFFYACLALAFGGGYRAGEGGRSCETLPPADQYCAMMDGRWAHPGWTLRPLFTGAPA